MNRDCWPGWFLDIDRHLAEVPLVERELLRLPLVDIGRPRAGDPRCSHLLFDSAAAPRVLSCIGWVLDDVGVPQNAERLALERALFVAAYLLHASAWIRHAVRDPALRLPVETFAAALALHRAGRRVLESLAGARSAPLAELDAAELAFDEALAEAFEREGSPESVTLAAYARWGAGVAIARAAAELGTADVDTMAEIVAAYLRGAQFRAELVFLQADANAGRRTGPMALLLAESGAALEGLEASEALAGATFTSVRLARWIRAEQARVAAALARARSVKAVCFARELSTLDSDLDLLAQAAGIVDLTGTAALPPRTLCAEPTPDLADALRRARAALLADPSMREAWEVHRWGLFDRPELTARKFPMALVIEHLAAAGLDVGTLADGVLRAYRADNYRYFDEPCPMPPDIDSFGAMLRIGAHAADRGRASEIIATPLGWLRSSMPADGDAPLWLLEGPPDDGWAEAFTALIGGSCVGCQVHLALGLLSQRELPLARRLSSAVARKLSQSGVAISAFYGAPYLMLILAELERALVREGGVEPSVLAVLAAERDRLIDEQARTDTTHQTAALLLLATEGDGALREQRRLWLDRVLRAQRSDGAWDDAPVYTVPRRGGLSSWYSSRLLTTAICHRALARALNQKGAFAGRPAANAARISDTAPHTR